MKTELSTRAEELGKETIQSIYFGGGTPSLLPVKDIDELLNHTGRLFDVANGVEITLETNPDDHDAQKLKQWHRAGVNRLSIGIQSFYDEDLSWMNRAHNAQQAIGCINLSLDAGFKNISADLIYGLPPSTNEQWADNVLRMLSSGINHLSAYALTVEKGTPLQRLIAKGKRTDTSDEKSFNHFQMLVQLIKENGWQQYEVSNFCFGENYSVHNTSYWKGNTYLGIGPSAHSFYRNKRSWNVRNNTRYVEYLEEGKAVWEHESLTKTDLYNEAIMTGLRTKWGIDIDELFTKTGYHLLQHNKAELEKHLQHQHLVLDAGQLKITEKGFFLADGIASSLFII